MAQRFKSWRRKNNIPPWFHNCISTSWFWLIPKILWQSETSHPHSIIFSNCGKCQDSHLRRKLRAGLWIYKYTYISLYNYLYNYLGSFDMSMYRVIFGNWYFSVVYHFGNVNYFNTYIDSNLYWRWPIWKIMLYLILASN